MTDEPKQIEMDQAHQDRVCRLLWETGSSPHGAKHSDFVAAYQAVLLKDVLFTLNELLIYRQQEVHR